MVFSLFKKKPEKMVPRPAVAARPDTGSKGKQAPAEEPARDESVESDFSSEFSDIGLTQSTLDFKVDDDFDPITGPAEEAAILFADNQDPSAQAILENALKQQQQSEQTERLWLMLFDLYRISGQQSAFDAIGIDYAREFEKSPPIWRHEFEVAAPAAKTSTLTPKGRGGVLFKGDLLGSNASSFDTVRQALEKTHALRLDLSKLKQVDAEGCAGLMELLRHARRHKREVELLGKDALVSLVKGSIEEGKKETPATGKDCWLLLLELLQQKGQQDVFEDFAIDYAVTFEESPPSWENREPAQPEPVEPEPVVEEIAAPDDSVYVLSGEIKASHFADLPTFAENQDPLLIDCTKLTRIDFASAGAMLNRLTTVRNSNKQIVLRHPNYLVAELFRVVGLTAVAVVVFAKQ